MKSSTRVVVASSAVVTLVAGLVWAQAGKVEDNMPEPDGGTPGRFAVSPAGDTVVLLDTATGETWTMTANPSDDERHVWLPTRLVQSIDDMQKFERDRDQMQQRKVISKQDEQRKAAAAEANAKQ